MNENTLQNFFENFLLSQKIPYEREFETSTGTIDFKIELNGKTCCVEVKSTKINIIHTLGQLLLHTKTFSHIFLVATEETLDKIRPLIEEFPPLNNIGLIILKKGTFLFIKEPNQDNYFFKEEKPFKNLLFSRKPKNIITTDLDTDILTKFENKTFNCIDIMKELKINRTEAYGRTNRLVKIGLLEEVSRYHPKTYRVKKTVLSGTKFSLEQPTQTKV